MTAIIRIVDSSYNIITDQVIFSVEVRYPEDIDLDRVFVVVAPRNLTFKKDTLTRFIEDDIISQREAFPNWVGVNWRSTRV